MTRLSTPADHVETQYDRRLADVLAIHFDPQDGTPFWIERAAAMGMDPRREIRSIADLPRLGTMSPADLTGRPIEDFLPRSLIEKRNELILQLPPVTNRVYVGPARPRRPPEPRDSSRADARPALSMRNAMHQVKLRTGVRQRLRRNDMVITQTGGTLGTGVWTAYLQDEFEAAFVTPFVMAAHHLRFPQGESWLYVGPSGPHAIGIAAQGIARAMGSLPPFAVDFDSRWAKKLPPQSFAAGRYLDHVVEQSMDIVTTQAVGVLFSTPPVLKRLANAMSDEQRRRIHGVHYGGMALSADELQAFQQDRFPNAVHLSGYGNTLFGCALELDASAGRRVRYFPHGHRLLMGIVRQDAGPAPLPDYHAVGRKGPLVFSRLDRSCLLLNVLERDEVTLVAPPAGTPEGFTANGVEAPQPIKHAAAPTQNLIY